MDRGALWATVHGVTKSWTWLSDSHKEDLKGVSEFQRISHDQIIFKYFPVHLWKQSLKKSNVRETTEGRERISLYSHKNGKRKTMLTICWTVMFKFSSLAHSLLCNQFFIPFNHGIMIYFHEICLSGIDRRDLKFLTQFTFTVWIFCSNEPKAYIQESIL